MEGVRTWAYLSVAAAVSVASMKLQNADELGDDEPLRLSCPCCHLDLVVAPQGRIDSRPGQKVRGCNDKLSGSHTMSALYESVTSPVKVVVR